MGFLEDLYLNGYQPYEDDRPDTTEYRQAAQRAREYEDKIIAHLGEQFMDDYNSAKADQVTFELAHAYAQGASFILDLFLSGREK